MKQCEKCGCNLDTIDKCDCDSIPQIVNKKYELELLLKQMLSFDTEIEGELHKYFLNRAKKFMYYYYKSNILIYKYYLDNDVILLKELSKASILLDRFKKVCFLHNDSYADIIKSVQATDTYLDMISCQKEFYDKRGKIYEKR